jgi:hypothetical protein
VAPDTRAPLQEAYDALTRGDAAEALRRLREAVTP